MILMTTKSPSTVAIPSIVGKIVLITLFLMIFVFSENAKVIEILC